jgi:cytochrome c biogenesis protein CcmG/thiol:disulfide interchange protein DsbE
MRRVVAPVPIAVIFVALALLALLAYGLAQTEPDRGVESALESGEPEQASEFTLPTLDGDAERSLADYRGQVVVLNFWASWCPPCRDESPLLESWQRRIARRGGLVLGVDVQDLTGDAQDFIEKYDLSYPMLKDRDGEVMAEYGVAQLPETFVIDRDGSVTAVRRGAVDEKFMEAEVAPLLRGS